MHAPRPDPRRFAPFESCFVSCGTTKPLTSSELSADTCAANGDLVDLERRLPDADRHGLTFLTANADAVVEREIVSDHRHARHHVGSGADQRGAFYGSSHLAVLDQIRLGSRKDELAGCDVDLTASEIDCV